MLCGYLMNQGFRAQDTINMLGIRSGKHIKSAHQVKYLTNPKFPENAAYKDYPESKIVTPGKAQCFTQPAREHTPSLPIPIKIESPRANSIEYSKSPSPQYSKSPAPQYSKSPSPHTNSFIASAVRRSSTASSYSPKTPVGTPKSFSDSVR